MYYLLLRIRNEKWNGEKNPAIKRLQKCDERGKMVKFTKTGLLITIIDVADSCQRFFRC